MAKVRQSVEHVHPYVRAMIYGFQTRYIEYDDGRPVKKKKRKKKFNKI